MAVASPDARIATSLPIPAWERDWKETENHLFRQPESLPRPPKTPFQSRLISLPHEGQLFVGYSLELANPSLPLDKVAVFNRELDKFIARTPKNVLRDTIKVMAWRAQYAPEEPWVNFFPR